MTLDVDSECTGDLLVFRMKGVTTQDAMLALADRIRAEADAHGVHRALLDCAGMTGALPIASLHRVAEYFGRTLADVRLAAINAPPSWKANHFSEDVIGSRGGELKHFAARESARRWLQET